MRKKLLLTKENLSSVTYKLGLYALMALFLLPNYSCGRLTSHGFGMTKEEERNPDDTQVLTFDCNGERMTISWGGLYGDLAKALDNTYSGFIRVDCDLTSEEKGWLRGFKIEIDRVSKTIEQAQECGIQVPEELRQLLTHARAELDWANGHQNNKAGLANAAASRISTSKPIIESVSECPMDVRIILYRGGIYAQNGEQVFTGRVDRDNGPQAANSAIDAIWRRMGSSDELLIHRIIGGQNTQSRHGKK